MTPIPTTANSPTIDQPQSTAASPAEAVRRPPRAPPRLGLAHLALLTLALVAVGV